MTVGWFRFLLRFSVSRQPYCRVNTVPLSGHLVIDVPQNFLRPHLFGDNSVGIVATSTVNCMSPGLQLCHKAMASDLVGTNVMAAEVAPHSDQQQHAISCNLPSVYPESDKFDVAIVDNKDLLSVCMAEEFQIDEPKFSKEEASKARPGADAEKEGNFERRSEQTVSSVAIPQCDIKHLEDESSGLVKGEETNDKDAQDNPVKKHSLGANLSSSSESVTKSETSLKHKDTEKRSKHKEMKCESKSQHVHSSDKIVAEHGHSNRDKVKPHKHSTPCSSSHQSTSKVDEKSKDSKHLKPSSGSHHHHHSDNHMTSKQKSDPMKDKGDKKLKEQGSSGHKQSDAAVKPGKDTSSHQKEKASSEAAAARRKRKLVDSCSDDSSSSDATRMSTVLQEKRAKMLSLVDKRKSELASSIPDDEGPADVETSSKGGNQGFQFPASAHTDLIASNKLVYEPIGLICTSKYMKEPESGEYAACTFSLNKRLIRFRVAKTTPTKNGQFVTFWKRIGKGPIMPYDAKDTVDLLLVCVRDGKNFGQFVFPKTALIAQDVMSRSGKGGKRAIRVYPPWVKPESTQAMNSQSWQGKYFLNMSDKTKLDLQRARRLFAA